MNPVLLKAVVSQAGSKNGRKVGCGCALFVVFILLFPLIILIMAFGAFSGSRTENSVVSDEVNAYSGVIVYALEENGLGEEWLDVIKAIMMQESAGQGTDPMQCSECPYNTRYPHSPGAIQDPSYSIYVGVKYFGSCLSQAQCTSPIDTNRLSLALQGYNYGGGYITWALSKYGEYTQENAAEFSDMKKSQLGWSVYGDPQYVPHVMRYLTTASMFGGGNQQIVNLALSQIGNTCYDYGWNYNWCAAFVAWCSQQTGNESLLPQTTSCWSGIQWYQSRGQFQLSLSQGGAYVPKAGDQIYINWNGVLGNDDGNHTGIVIGCDGSMVYTVEGNTNSNSWSTSQVAQHQYSISSPYIVGYGVPAYPADTESEGT